MPAPSFAVERPLRVAHITGEAGPHFANGVSRAIFHLIGSQRALGHDAVAISGLDEGLNQGHDDEAGEVVGKHRSPADVPRSRARVASAEARESWVPAEAWLVPSVRRTFAPLVRRLMEFQPDIVHLHSIHVLANVALARHLRHVGLPYCVTIHGGLFGRTRGRLKKAAFWWLAERAYLNGAQFVHALTDDEAADLRVCGVTSPIVVAPNGIDVAALPRPTDPRALFTLVPELIGKRVFIYMGRLDPMQKGLDLLIPALARANVTDARLVLLGPDWKNGKAGLQGLVNRLGLESRVVFLDAAGPARCADLVAGADVFVHASRWEGLSLAVLEAAAWEKASLLTRAADPMGALGAAGGATVVEPTIDGLADGIRLLSEIDRADLITMGRRAGAVVSSSFRWANAAKTLLDAYRPATVLSRSADPGVIPVQQRSVS